ncbi:hypothetical protein D3C86_1699440 [compost metagenome]
MLQPPQLRAGILPTLQFALQAGLQRRAQRLAGPVPQFASGQALPPRAIQAGPAAHGGQQLLDPITVLLQLSLQLLALTAPVAAVLVFDAGHPHHLKAPPLAA